MKEAVQNVKTDCNRNSTAYFFRNTENVPKCAAAESHLHLLKQNNFK